MNEPITAAQAYARSLEVNSVVETLSNIWGLIRQAMDQGLYVVQTEVSESELPILLEALEGAGFIISYSEAQGGYNLSVNWSSPPTS
jgi:hypothetical protein